MPNSFQKIHLFRGHTLICWIPGRARASEEPGHHGEDNEAERRRAHLDVLQIDFPIPRDLICVMTSFGIKQCKRAMIWRDECLAVGTVLVKASGQMIFSFPPRINVLLRFLVATLHSSVIMSSACDLCSGNIWSNDNYDGSACQSCLNFVWMLEHLTLSKRLGSHLYQCHTGIKYSSQF